MILKDFPCSLLVGLQFQALAVPTTNTLPSYLYVLLVLAFGKHAHGLTGSRMPTN